MAAAAVVVVLVFVVTRPANSVRDGVLTLEQAIRGEAVYARSCSRCHGEDLAGWIETPPLAGSTFRRKWNGRTLAELYGFVSVNMPRNRPGTLDPQTYIDVIAYVLQMSGYPVGRQELAADAAALAAIRIEPP